MDLHRVAGPGGGGMDRAAGHGAGAWMGADGAVAGCGVPLQLCADGCGDADAGGGVDGADDAEACQQFRTRALRPWQA